MKYLAQRVLICVLAFFVGYGIGTIFVSLWGIK